MKLKTNFKKMLRKGLVFGMASIMAFSIPVYGKTTISKWRSLNISNTYTSTQGMCMDNSNNIFVAKESKNHEVQIYKIPTSGSNAKKPIEIIYRKSAFGHANDMTYCSKDKRIYIATSGGGETGSADIISLKKSNGNYVVAEKINYPELSNATGIAYDASLDVFFIKKGKNVNICRLINGAFQTRGSFELSYGKHNGYVGQGITAHNGTIFIPLWDESGQRNSVVRKYSVTKHAETVYTISYLSSARYDDNESSNNLFEMEGLDFSTSGEIYFATNDDSGDGIYKTSGGIIEASATQQTSLSNNTTTNIDIASLCFDYQYYADRYWDLKAAFGYNRDLLYNHWTTYGINEGRSASPILDLMFYVESNPDLKAAYGNNYRAAYEHFITWGYKEYRISSQYYHGGYYKNAYSDLQGFDSAFLINHYMQYGINEGRWANTQRYIR